MSPPRDRLLSAVAACLPQALPLESWVGSLARDRSGDRSGLVVDASFSLRGDGRATARCSVNDRGDPVGFREALRALPLTVRVLDGFFAIAPPGAAQTTAGFKWGAGRLDRVTLYYEELTMTPDRARVAREVAALAGVDAPEAPMMAVAVDVSGASGEVVGFKQYAAALDRPGAPGHPPLPGALEAFRARLPLHRGARRLLVAERRAAHGITGRKLLWVPEVRYGAVEAAWETVTALRAALRLPSSAPGGALDRLTGDDAFYPDLVSLDTEPDGTPVGLTVYVAERPASSPK